MRERAFPPPIFWGRNQPLYRWFKVSSNACTNQWGQGVREIDDEHWWSERLEAWSHEGFNVEYFTEELAKEPLRASELLLDFEDMVSKNRSLRRRVIESTMTTEQKNDWLSELDNVENTKNILQKWEENASLNRPWEPYIHKAEGRWTENGRRNGLSSILRRLNALDPSSYSACQPLFILFDDVSSEMLINSMLDDIEKDEMRRREIIDEMVALLASEKIDASDARNMTINDALDYLSSLQSSADNSRKNRLRIEKEIRPYDEELANKLLEKNSENLTEEVDAIINNLSQRLSSLSSTIEEWKDLGVKFPDEGKLLPENLLDWEAGLPEIEGAVEIHLRALERWKEFATFWPDRCTDKSLVGRLDKTEQFVDLVDSLEQEWRELELEGMQIIGSWQDKGFAMDVWRSRLVEEPRSTISWLKREEANYIVAYSLIESLMALDASIEGEEEISRRVTILREFDLDSALLEEMSLFIETKARRSARHRSMLEMDWMELVRKGLVEDRPTASLSLAEFENLLADSRMNKQSRGIPAGRLEGKMQEEIDSWYQQGFSVENLKQMLEENPIGLALRMASIREAVAGHEALRRRVTGLDWTRSPRLSVEVNLDLSMPERLPGLAARVPQLMMELAQKEVEDSDFKFIAWRPRVRSRPVLVPVPKNTVEDAMEAILHEMDKENAETESSVEIETDEEISSPEEETETEEEIVEEEPPKKKSGGIKSLVSGGGKDGVGKFGAVGDMLGGITDRLGVTSYGLAGKSKKEQEKGENSDSEDGIIAGDSSSVEAILRSLGLESEADMLADNGDINAVRRALAPHVGIEPRDTRLDRLLRLCLRLMPKGDESDEQRYALLALLAELANELSKWTRIRLEARHSGAQGNLIQDSKTLGEALNRIPGPGTPLPLGADDYDLPAPDDIEGLSNEVKVLKRRVSLSSSGGVR